MTTNLQAENGSLDQIRKEVLRWFAKGRVGRSSKTIAAAMAEVESDVVDIPHDPSDFIRCLKMLEACPSIKNLSKVKTVYPAFAPIIDNWNTMVDLLKQDEQDYDGRAPTLYAYMKKREAEYYFLKGQIIDSCRYVDVADFEDRYDVKVTLDNLHECIKKAKQSPVFA